MERVVRGHLRQRAALGGRCAAYLVRTPDRVRAPETPGRLGPTGLGPTGLGALGLGALGLCALGLVACADLGDGAEGRSIALRDPTGVLGSVTGDLRLVVVPAGDYACDPATGRLAPNPPEDPPGAAVAGSVVDIRFAPAAGATVNVRPGTWALLVRGRGTDVVSGRMDQVICTGCATSEIADGETRDVDIELKQAVGEGLCGDRTLSPDEQCEDGNTAPGDGCDATCRTETFMISRRAGGEAARETLPAIGWSPGGRVIAAYDSDSGSREVNMMVLDEAGAIITTPTALSVDTPVEVLAGVQTTPAAASSPSRLAVAFADFQGTSLGGDARVRFFATDRSPLGASAVATTDSADAQTDPAIGMMPDGAAMVVFVDPGSPTGLSGRVFAAGSITPAGASDFPVGTGATGATGPSVAGHTSGFVVAFTAGGDVFVQRFGPDGTPLDPSALPVLSGAEAMGDQLAPAVAALPDGRSIVAWQDGGAFADGAGSGIRARVMGADGMFAAEAITVNTTVAGDQLAPAVAAGQERFVVAWVSGTELRARMLDGAGNAALNREETPTSDDFVFATGPVSNVSLAAGGRTGAATWMAAWQDTSMDPAGDIRGRLFALP